MYWKALAILKSHNIRQECYLWYCPYHTYQKSWTQLEDAFSYLSQQLRNIRFFFCDWTLQITFWWHEIGSIFWIKTALKICLYYPEFHLFSRQISDIYMVCVKCIWQCWRIRRWSGLRNSTLNYMCANTFMLAYNTFF